MLELSLLALTSLLSAFGCYYFSTIRPVRPATVMMALLTAFSSSEAGFLCLARIVVGMNDPERLIRLLRSPLVILPGVLGVAGTGLLLVLIIRREARAKD